MKFDVLKYQVSIMTVLQDKGYLRFLRKRGNDLVGPCPVHGGDNPNAFVVSLKKNLWHCFTRCGGGGDVIELVRRMNGSSYTEIARYLSQLSRKSANSVFRLEKHSAKTRTQKRTNQIPFKPFTKRLTLDCYAPFLISKGILPTTAGYFEAGAYHWRGMLTGCVAVRLHDLKGRPIGYAGRRLDPVQALSHGKWVFPKGLLKKWILFNYHRVVSYSTHALVIVECPWGVMRLAQLGIPAVALLGLNLSEQQVERLNKWNKIVIMLDGDLPGLKATKSMAAQLRRNAIEPICIFLPNGLDPDDLNDQMMFNLLKSHLH